MMKLQVASSKLLRVEHIMRRRNGVRKGEGRGGGVGYYIMGR
jgi:hypothetical protein